MHTGCSSLWRKKAAPLCCINLDTATDPCAGSGHILAYMFGMLMKIYESYGYTIREAVTSSVENNIYGLDIDGRAVQLAYFAIMMKARQYDCQFFSRSIQPHVYAIVESNHVDKFAVEYFCNGDADTIIGYIGCCGLDSVCWVNAIVIAVKTVKESEVLL